MDYSIISKNISISVSIDAAIPLGEIVWSLWFNLARGQENQKACVRLRCLVQNRILGMAVRMDAHSNKIMQHDWCIWCGRIKHSLSTVVELDAPNDRHCFVPPYRLDLAANVHCWLQQWRSNFVQSVILEIHNLMLLICILNISDTLPLRKSHILAESSSPSTFSATESWEFLWGHQLKTFNNENILPWMKGSRRASLLWCKGHCLAHVWDFSCKQMMWFSPLKAINKKTSSHWKQRAKFVLPSFLSFETDPNVHLQDIHPTLTSSGNRFCLDRWTPIFDGWGGWISSNLRKAHRLGSAKSWGICYACPIVDGWNPAPVDK